MSAHKHNAIDRGCVYEYCECGAVRRRCRAGEPHDAWHVCSKCVLPGFEYVVRAERETLLRTKTHSISKPIHEVQAPLWSTATLFMAGYRMHDVEPLELTVMFTRPLGVPKYMVCGIGDDGEPEVMFQGEFHQTIQEARRSAWEFAEKIAKRSNGMRVAYRSDLES